MHACPTFHRLLGASHVSVNRAQPGQRASLLGRAAGAPRAALLALIQGYQTWISPALPGACRYQPTCSQYAANAIAKYGAAQGSWLALRRIARCQPWGGSGYDPVP